MRKKVKDQMLELAEKLGVPVFEQISPLNALQFNYLRTIDLLPEMIIMMRSLVAKEAFSFRREPITVIKNGLLFSFQNVFNDGQENVADLASNLQQERSHVRITPLHMTSEVRFAKQAHIKQITIIIEMAYLIRFLGKDRQPFGYLFDAESTFWIEEFMSPEIASCIDQMLNSSNTISFPDLFYSMKALELLYFLFNNLSRRESVSHQQVTRDEINKVYEVRNAMAASLDRALSISELVKISGMNELKLRKVFTQVFGKGLYAYFQYIRMEEAARLLREEHLSVSEVGYRLGFSNLSHFGRLFEEHKGMKPKKWSSQNH
ncbi:helix-turn-helix transcriptional regulator [Xanthocytophaga agilis]|uniref:Helix-turn-helix transcriptional regulator n=1 Tax=Xanthocytophaga agilis TaxID=3048010 RepID=A0AAE3UHL6_9BACT|nr:helix-turn-helix transcriptional regulator [Xanthocytophaga agilis]MDJ1506128.1 helix-turn-helix transcriptional regulator [Xanthocytophaga agilis]